MNVEPSAPAEITLRPENNADEPLLYELYADTRAEEMAALNWPPVMRESFVRMQFLAQRKGYREMFPHAVFSMVLAGAQAIGRMVVNRTEDEIRLVDLVLLPAWRGRGIGTRLLNALCSEAAASRKPLRLHVLRGSRARGLYDRLGFCRRAEEGVYEEMERPVTT